MQRVAIFQFAPQGRSVSQNVDYITYKLQRTNNALVVLPEFFLSSYFEYDFLEWKDIKQILEPILKLSAASSLTIGGSLPVEEDGKRFNRGILVEDGKIFYKDKIELFGSEKTIFDSGRQESPIKLKNSQVCMQVCMDISNPTHAWREAKGAGAEIIINPSTASLPFLHTINKSRAMENQVPSIFVNRCGEDVNGIKYMGKSAIFYPDGGEIMLGSAEEIRIIESSDRPKFTCGESK